MEFDRIRQARDVVAKLSALGAPRQETKEIIEACLGLRVTRLQLSPKGVTALLALGEEFSFGVVTGRYGIRSVPTHGLGQWADGIGEATDLGDPNAAVNVYLAHTEELAERGRRAEEEYGDDAFGEILGIPRCCRDFYQRELTDVAKGTQSFHWMVARSMECHKNAAAGCNFFGRYFGGSLLSHFPCSLSCEKSVEIARQTRAALIQVNPSLATALASTHFWAFLVKRQGTITGFPVVQQTGDGGFSVAEGILPADESEVLLRTPSARISQDGSMLKIMNRAGAEQVLSADEARFVYAGTSL
jgi:hypothetical protein